MRTIRLLAATVLAGALLVAVNASSEAGPGDSPGSKNLRTPYTSVMKNEYYQLYGQVPSTADERPVALQYKSGSTWKTRTTARSDVEGYFGFTVRSTRATTWRFRAASTSSEPAVVGYSKKITVVPQTATAVVVPSEVCVGPAGATIQVFARFVAPRKGRDARLDSAGDTFDGETDARGNVILTDPDAPSTLGRHYVSVRVPYYAGAAAKTATASYDVIPCLE